MTEKVPFDRRKAFTGGATADQIVAPNHAQTSTINIRTPLVVRPASPRAQITTENEKIPATHNRDGCVGTSRPDDDSESLSTSCRTLFLEAPPPWDVAGGFAPVRFPAFADDPRCLELGA